MQAHEHDQATWRMVHALETIASFYAFQRGLIEKQIAHNEAVLAQQNEARERWEREQHLARQVEEATPEELRGTRVDPAALQVEFMYNLNEYLKRQMSDGDETT